MNAGQIASTIEHSLLGAGAVSGDIRRLCSEALEYGFYSVCINPVHVPLAARILDGSSVRVTTVADFPLGASAPALKAREAMESVMAGADEIDMVMDVGAAIEGRWAVVEQGISDVRYAIKGHCASPVLKVIIECCYLEDTQKRRATEVAVAAGADYVKTSTGFGPSGATADDVALIRKAINGRARIKAAGGIKTLADYTRMMEAGADLIGASSGVNILREAGLIR